MVIFPPPDIEEFYRYASVIGFSVSELSDTAAVISNLSGSYEVWELGLESHYPVMISHGGKNFRTVDYDPEARYLVVAADDAGDETTQLYLLPPKGGELVPLIVHPGFRHHVLHISEDGNRLYYASNHENPQFYNNYIRDLSTGTDTLLLEGTDVPTIIIQVSPQETAWIALKSYANTHMTAWFGNSQGLVSIVPHPQEAHVVASAVFVSETEVWLATNYQAEHNYLARYRREQMALEKVLEIPGEDIVDLQYDRTRKQILCLTDCGVDQRAYRVSTEDPKPEEVTLPVTVVTQQTVTKSGTWYLAGQSETAPTNLFRLTGGKWQALTENRSLGISVADATHAKVIRYPSFDGLEIESLWFSPATRNGYTILWPHGGPQAIERRQFRPLFQYLTQLGYQIFSPNFRGSTGYGQRFAQMVEGDWGGGPRKDILAGLDWLAAKGWMDAEKLFVVGGSYGGYMALLLHGRHPERFRAVVDIFGPSDLRTFAASVPETWKPIMHRFLGDPETDAQRFIEDSPITYVEHMTRPMLVVQGANDPRVVKAESDQMVAALRDRGRTVEYLVLEDEGHGFTKKDNEIRAYRAITEFLERQRAKD